MVGVDRDARELDSNRGAAFPAVGVHAAQRTKPIPCGKVLARGPGGSHRRRYRGPPASANGGYTCGILAASSRRRGAEVNLRRRRRSTAPSGLSPTSKRRELSTTETAGRRAAGRSTSSSWSCRGHRRCTWRRPRTPATPTTTTTPSRAASSVARPRAGRRPLDLSRGRRGPSAWRACGRRRHTGRRAGAVRDEIVWAALDCPSGNAAHHFSPDERWMVLGPAARDAPRPRRAGGPHIVVGWATGADGRKHGSGIGDLRRRRDRAGIRAGALDRAARGRAVSAPTGLERAPRGRARAGHDPLRRGGPARGAARRVLHDDLHALPSFRIAAATSAASRDLAHIVDPQHLRTCARARGHWRRPSPRCARRRPGR